VSRSLSEIVSLTISGAWRRRYLIAIPILVMPALGVVASRLVPKAYESRMTILVQEPDRLNPILNDIAIGADVKDRMPALLALLKSKHVLVDVLRDLGQITPQTDPRTEDIRVGTLGAALNAQLTGSDLIEFKIRGPQADGLSKTLNAVSARFIEHVVSPGRGAVEISEDFLQSQLGERDRALASAENAYTEFKARNADNLPALYTANVTRLAAMQQKLEETRIELATADASFEDLRARVSTLNPVVGRLEEAIVQASSELATLRSRYTDEHSEVQAAQRKLQRLEEERANVLSNTNHENGADMQRLWNMAAGVATGGEKGNAPLLVVQMTQIQEADAKRAALRKEVEQLTKGVEELRTAIALFAPIEQEQQQLEHAIASAREMHDMLAKRYEMARLTGSLGRFEAPERIKIIDAPQDPTAPVTPGSLAFVLEGLVGGIVLGAGLAIVFEVLDPRLRRAKDFEEAAGLPVIAFVPRIQIA
jgi:polysaccharide chain length determinant protein (PEP-CTERM system associated)